MDRYIIEKEKRIQVMDQTDVLVAGGGTAGVIAAIAAARSGADVLLVEQFGALGGSATEGLVTPMMNVSIEGNPMCSSISDEINSKMIEMGYGAEDIQDNKGYFDPLMLEFALEDMAVQAGVRLLYYTCICDVLKENVSLKGVIIENKAGRSAILASRVIDCTGDGDVARRAGVRFEKGNPDTGKNQPMSVRYIMSGVDIGRFDEFLSSLGGKGRYSPHLFHAAVVWGSNHPLESVFKKALDAGELTYEDGAYWQVFGVPGKPDVLAFNCPEIFEGVDGVNPQDLTNAQVYAKKAIMRHLMFYKKYIPGFEGSYISSVASQVGIRESIRIRGIYYLTDDDIIMYRKFEDHIARSNYPIDIHGKKLVNRYMDAEGKDIVPYYEIPYRCLVPEGMSNLLVAGRCISASFLAQSSLRIQPTVRAMGEAAGTAAAMSISKGIGVDGIDGKEVREKMLRRGAVFG